MKFERPRDGSSVLILGRNGSGKTVAAIEQLAGRSYTTMPWIIFDYKGDEHIAQIEDEGAKEIDLGGLPKRAGLYIARPHVSDTASVTNFLWKIHEQERVGLYIDEGYMIDKGDDALSALYTQGRSKKISIITLSQRPVLINRFAISEASFYRVFHLNDRRDRKTIQEVIPSDTIDLEKPLERFHSYWYDVGQSYAAHLTPARPVDSIMAIFGKRLRPVRRFL